MGGSSNPHIPPYSFPQQCLVLHTADVPCFSTCILTSLHMSCQKNTLWVATGCLVKPANRILSACNNLQSLNTPHAAPVFCTHIRPTPPLCMSVSLFPSACLGALCCCLLALQPHASRAAAPWPHVISRGHLQLWGDDVGGLHGTAGLQTPTLR